MRPMRANRKLKLEEKLVGGLALCIPRASRLTTDLTELARPVGHRPRSAGIVCGPVLGPIGTVEPEAGVPSARQLVLAGDIEARRLLHAVRLIATAPNQLGTADKRAVDRSLQGPP